MMKSRTPTGELLGINLGSILMPGWWDWNAVAAIGQVLGAVATLAAVIVALRAEWRAYHPRLTVWVKPTCCASAPDWKLLRLLTVRAINHSVLPIDIVFGIAELPGGKHFLPIEFPEEFRTVKQWGAVHATIPYEVIADAVRRAGLTVPIKMRVYVLDATGRKHWCKFRFDPAPWLVEPQVADPNLAR